MSGCGLHCWLHLLLQHLLLLHLLLLVLHLLLLLLLVLLVLLLLLLLLRIVVLLPVPVLPLLSTPLVLRTLSHAVRGRRGVVHVAYISGRANCRDNRCCCWAVRCSRGCVRQRRRGLQLDTHRALPLRMLAALVVKVKPPGGRVAQRFPLCSLGCFRCFLDSSAARYFLLSAPLVRLSSFLLRL
jgi:hypothetical protein